MGKNVKIALVQMSCAKEAEVNLKKAIRLVKKAAANGARIVCLQELFLGLYFCQRKNDRAAFLKAEAIPGPTTQALSNLAKQLKIVLVGGSIFEKSSKGKFFNTAVVFGPDGKLLAKYRKTHIPEDFLYHEQHYFEPSHDGYQVIQTPYGKIAVLICFDQWFPEAARAVTLKGAEIIFYPTAIGVIDDEVEENITGDWETMWRNVQLGHAAANGVYVAAVNRVGREDHIRFWGGSFVADPSSKVLALAKSKEGILYANCELGRVKSIQKAWGFLRNRRPETYSSLLQKVSRKLK